MHSGFTAFIILPKVDSVKSVENFNIMKFLLLKFASTPLVVFQVDEFIKIVQSYLLTYFLVAKFNDPDAQICHNFICIICTLLNTVCV